MCSFTCSHAAARCTSTRCRRQLPKTRRLAWYIQNAVSTGSSPTDQVAQLANLKAQGVIDEAEFQKMKAKVVGS